jgi:hypothetical protein
MDIGLHPTYLNICSSYESVGNEGGLLELHAARQGLCNPDGGRPDGQSGVSKFRSKTCCLLGCGWVSGRDRVALCEGASILTIHANNDIDATFPCASLLLGFGRYAL